MKNIKLKGLRQARLINGYDRQTFANLMFVDATTISKWESETRSPGPFDLAKLSDILFTSTTFLITGRYF